MSASVKEPARTAKVTTPAECEIRIERVFDTPSSGTYTTSKMAIEGFTASLALELETFNVRVKLVEPGYSPTTRFTANTGPRMDGLIPEAYAPFAQRILASIAQGPAAVTTESDVTEVVWRAANDASGQLRFPAGADTAALAHPR